MFGSLCQCATVNNQHGIRALVQVIVHVQPGFPKKKPETELGAPPKPQEKAANPPKELTTTLVPRSE
eukprot:3724487-Amphidinium_carterae.3